MKRRARVGVAIWALMTAWAWGGDVKLIPGVQVEFDVPAAPPSMANQLRKQTDEPVRMSIKVPRDYDPTRAYPVLVFLTGGDGGKGGELHLADPFLGGEGYVLCNIPLFKRVVDTDRDEVKWSITPADAPYAAPALKLMLDELRRRVPNVDASRSVLAGFSNGAATVALLLWMGDPDLLARFSHYILIEGGFWLGSDLDVETGIRFKPATLAGLAQKRVLVMYGDQRTPADRVPWIQAAQKTVAALRQAGISVEEMAMKNVGHDFPPDAMARAREWVKAAD